MFLKRAMRYYRVWIYSCNAALFLSTALFLSFAIWNLSDIHLSLFSSVSFFHPSFIYGLVALLLQGGVLQAIGCIGALKMNEKLLNLYWLLLVVLLFGDAIVGVVWLFRYDFLVTNLRSDLKYKLNNDYGIDPSFQELWDRIQVDSECCGIDGPYDYNMSQWLQKQQQEFPNYSQLVPRSCCRAVPVNHLSHLSSSSSHLSSSSLIFEERNFQHFNKNSNETISNSHEHHHQQRHSRKHRHTRRRSRSSGGVKCFETYSPDLINQYGCYDNILQWLQRTVDTLAVLGFCVMSFLKMCFAFILRYEIKEMIQKIQVLKGGDELLPGSGNTSNNPVTNPSAAIHELEEFLPRPSIQHESNIALSNSGNVITSPVSANADPHNRRRLNSRVEQVRHSSITSATGGAGVSGLCNTTTATTSSTMASGSRTGHDTIITHRGSSTSIQSSRTQPALV